MGLAGRAIKRNATLESDGNDALGIDLNNRNAWAAPQYHAHGSVSAQTLLIIDADISGEVDVTPLTENITLRLVNGLDDQRHTVNVTQAAPGGWTVTADGLLDDPRNLLGNVDPAVSSRSKIEMERVGGRWRVIDVLGVVGSALPAIPSNTILGNDGPATAQPTALTPTEVRQMLLQQQNNNTFFDITDAPIITPDRNNGRMQYLQSFQDFTLLPPINFNFGEDLLLYVENAGGVTITLDSQYRTIGGAGIVISPGFGAEDRFEIVRRDTNRYDIRQLADWQ